MKNFLQAVAKSIKKIGAVPFLLAAVAILFVGGAPFAHTPSEIARYNEAIDGMYGSHAPESLNILQSLWHEAQNPTVREASAYNLGTIVGGEKSQQAQTLALQALLDAVRMNPNDERAKKNLEILLRRIVEQAQQKDSSNSDKSQQEKENKDSMPKNNHDYGHSQLPSEF